MMWQALKRLIKSQRFRFYIYIYIYVYIRQTRIYKARTWTLNTLGKKQPYALGR